jgi:hypothetical protein
MITETTNLALSQTLDEYKDSLEKQKIVLPRVAIGHNLTCAETIDWLTEFCVISPQYSPLLEWAHSELAACMADCDEERGSRITLQNYYWMQRVNNDRKQAIRVPRRMADIVDEVQAYTHGAIKRVDNVLFVDDRQHGLHCFDRNPVAGIVGYLRSLFDVRWAKGGDFVGQAELVAELQRTAPRFDTIELLPHEPLVPNVYYRGDAPQLGDGSHLRRLLDRFRPETTIDRDLIRAAFMTAFWGGPAGCRPAFVVTSDDGRGVGKTALAESIGLLCGGVIDVSAGEDIATIKQRMLSPEGQTKRILLLDNLKSLRFSWAELEALITAPMISGKRMYVGEGQRPNLLTPILTLNGVSLATDMAQRSVIIKLVRGDNSGTWWEETIQFIDQHREKIIGDIIAELRAESAPLANYSRWAAWEQHVLSRLPNPAEAQRVILERQGESNCEQDEAEIIEQYFAGQLVANGYEPNTAQVRLPVSTVAAWFGTATGERFRTAAASRRLHQLANEGQLKRIAPDASRRHGRCFIWTGQQADVLGDSIVNFVSSFEQHEVEAA